MPGASFRQDVAPAPTIEQVADAVRAIMEPSCPAALRSQAHAVCEGVKTHQNAVEYGFQLATLAMPLPVRLFGLNVLENYVRTRLVPAEAAALTDGVWSLLALVVVVAPEERRLMQDKSAMLVAQLAMRIWPQYWPDFFDRLLGLVAPSGTVLENDPNAVVRTEMGLLMARMVVDEIHPREGVNQKLIWDDARRPELQKAVAVVLPAMMERLYVLLAHCAAWPPASLHGLRQLVETIMEAFGSISLWTPLERQPALAAIVGIVQVASCCSELTGAALDVLLTVAGRVPRALELDLVSDLFDSLVDPVRALLGRLAATAADSYDHFKKLANVLVTLATTNLGHKKSPCIPARLDAVFDLLLELSNFPSLLLVSNVGSFWNALSKNEKMMANPAVLARLPSLFLYALFTLAQSKKTERHRVPFNTEDFCVDDSEADTDFDALFDTHQNRTLELLRQLSVHQPSLLAQYCAGALGTFIAERPGLVAEVGGVEEQQWDALVHAADCVLKSCLCKIESSQDPTGEVAAQVSKIGVILCGESLDLRTVNPKILYLWFVSMRVLIPALGALSSPLFPTLMQKLFDITLNYEIPASANWPLEKIPSMRHAIRARAGTTILKVCHSQPSLFIPALDYLVGVFRESVSSASGEADQRIRERRLLSEMLLVIAGSTTVPAQKGEILRLVLTPVAESLDRLASGLAGGHRSLLRSSGLGAGLIDSSYGVAGDAASAEYRKQWSNLSALLYIILGQLKRLAVSEDARVLIAQFVPPVSTAVGRCIMAIHAAFDRRQYEQPVLGKWEALFSEDSATMASDMPATEKLLDAENIADSMGIYPGKSLRGWACMLRVTCYMNFGCLYAIDPRSMYAQLPLSFFDGHESFSITQWMLLSKHLVSPMLLSLPPSETMSALQREKLCQLLVLVFERFGLTQLEAAWQSFKTAQALPTSAETVQREAAQETLLSTATSSLLSLLYDVLYPVSERDKRIDPVLDVSVLQDRTKLNNGLPSRSPLACWIMTDPTLSAKASLLLLAVLRWKPTMSLGKTLSVLMHWLPTLMSNQSLHETLFGPLSTCLLSFVTSSGLGDFYPSVVNALTELYKWQLLFGYEVLDRQIMALWADPAVPSAIIQDLRAHFATAANIKSQRLYVRGRLIKPLQQQALSAAGITSMVPRLPDRVVLLRKLKQQDADPEDQNIDLASLFDQ